MTLARTSPFQQWPSPRWANTVWQLETEPESRGAKRARRFLLGRCIYEPSARAVCVQSHRRCHAVLSPLYSILRWPGIHTALITCFIVSLGTAAESVEKLTLRILGCLAGAGLGLLVMLRVIPLVTSIGGMAVIVFMGAFLGAWIAVGDKHISYAGFQVAFAYFLCVIQGPSPSFDMVVARDRVIGILLGNVVSYFVATRIWPVSVGPRIGNSISQGQDPESRAASKRSMDGRGGVWPPRHSRYWTRREAISVWPPMSPRRSDLEALGSARNSMR